MERLFEFTDLCRPVSEGKTSRDIAVPPDAVLFFGSYTLREQSANTFLAYFSSADGYVKQGGDFRFGSPKKANAAAYELRMIETIAGQTALGLARKLHGLGIETAKIGSVYYTKTGAAAALQHEVFEAETLTAQDRKTLATLVRPMKIVPAARQVEEAKL